MSDLIRRGDVYKALWARHKHEGMGLDALIAMEDALDAVVSIHAVDAVDGDLISRAALLDDIDSERGILIEDGRLGAEHIVVHHARRLIEDAPTVDAVEVVRCKDCDWGIPHAALPIVICTHNGKRRNKRAYCSMGRRKDGGEKDAEERDTKEAATNAEERSV